MNDTVRAFVSANIPLQKLDHPAIREWLNEYIKGAGDLPNATTLRSSYMNILKMEEESKIKEAVKDQAIHLQESNANPKLFPSPVVTLWNSWFHAVEYLDEYLTHLVTFFKKEDCDCNAAVEYFKQLEDEKTVLKCQSKFMVEHCKQTVDLLKILEGSSYSFADKLHSKLSYLKTCFKLVRQKWFLKLSSLVGADPAKLFLENVGRLFDPRNIIAKDPEVDALDVEARVKTLPVLSS
ncbi:hypothetical protein PR048_019225 [Dryococelus australis]|uniref:Uncharacterized protein n=1 Tax=Dryococelus australis TaxID=614101 RepID=A0ABQ9H2X9_9NEOP|nr:hypothetical protein PR048_019225 [Dryococelus australis]